MQIFCVCWVAGGCFLVLFAFSRLVFLFGFAWLCLPNEAEAHRLRNAHTFICTSSLGDLCEKVRTSGSRRGAPRVSSARGPRLWPTSKAAPCRTLGRVDTTTASTIKQELCGFDRKGMPGTCRSRCRSTAVTCPNKHPWDTQAKSCVAGRCQSTAASRGSSR